MKPDPSLSSREGYFDAAASWSVDVQGSLRGSRRLAWWVACGACLVAVLEAIALTVLSPLKTVVPYAITVDRQTGYVEAVKPLAPGPLNQNQAVTQSNLARYVLARETFDATDLRESYRNVMRWSAGAVRDDYVRLMQKTTPESPLNLYAPTTTVAVTIKSVSLLSPTTALVRFDTRRTELGGGGGARRSWVAAIAFRYNSGALRAGDRFINPLGFEVVRYRRDDEAPGASDSAEPAPGERPESAL